MRLSNSGLWTRLKDHATVVTSSPILAAVASQQFARSQLDRGNLSWPRPAIYSLDAWLTVCWQEARYTAPDVPSLLSSAQELLLWEQIIHHSAADLFDASAIARLARDASRLTVEWQIPLSDESWNLHADAQQFQRWHAEFRKHCDTLGWITRNDALRLLPSWIKQRLCSNEPVLFAAFDNPSPSVSEVVRMAGSPVPMPARVSSKKQRHSVRQCADFRAELEAAARWARAQIEDNPTRSLGIFVPNLPEHRSLIERTFQNVFYPKSGLRLLSETRPAAADDPSIFHINRAQSLYEHPLVANALLFLELARPRIDNSAAAAILRSPFVSGALPERSLRAIADLTLRRLREFDVSLRDIEYATRSCPLFAAPWKRIREVLRSQPRQAEVSAWSRFFGDLVQAAGWPGDTELTAAEQQIVEGWKDSLSALAGLGLVSPPLTFDSALNRFRQILGAGGMQCGDWYSPIQILDATDAPGLEFDAVFVVGLSEEIWPSPLRISPLIPLQLQRACGLPNSTPALLQNERLRLTEALFQSAPHVSGTFTERLSPLAAQHARTVSGQNPADWSGNLPVASFLPATLDEIADSNAPPFDITRDAMGGTGIIKSQSLCPFRAFAEYRLGSQSPEDSCFGFDARDRGGFLHKALQIVWAELKDSATLKTISDSALETLIRDSVLQAVAGGRDSDFHTQTTLVERQRLENLLLEWLNDVEKARKQPFTVEQIENELQYNLAGLPLRLRVDRMDRLKNGALLLIDYKSGKVSKNKLDCPRPAEPQLLVYASAKSPQVEGLLFGSVRARESRLVGKTRDRHVSGGSTAVLGGDWDNLIAQAEDEVRRLASDFLAGNALVDPTKGACDYCANKPLCRVNETAAQNEDEA